MCTFGVLGLSCEARAAPMFCVCHGPVARSLHFSPFLPWVPGEVQPESPNVHISGKAPAFETPPKFHEKLPQGRGRKNEEGAEEGGQEELAKVQLAKVDHNFRVRGSGYRVV